MVRVLERTLTLRELPSTSEAALSIAEIVDRLDGLSASTIERARDDLKARGEVLRRGKGVKGDPYRFWAPQPDEDDAFPPSAPQSEFGQNETPPEDDYPRSAWDPEVDQEDQEFARWTGAPLGEPGGGLAS